MNICPVCGGDRDTNDVNLAVKELRALFPGASFTHNPGGGCFYWLPHHNPPDLQIGMQCNACDTVKVCEALGCTVEQLRARYPTAPSA